MDTPLAHPVAGSAYGGEGHPGRAGRLAGCGGGGCWRTMALDPLMQVATGAAHVPESA